MEDKMRNTMRRLIIVLLVVSGMALLAGNAQADINLQEKEHLQTIMWVIAIVSIVTALAIGWFVWRISKRAKENKKF